MTTIYFVLARRSRAALVCMALACAGAGAQAESRKPLVLEDGERLEALQVLSVIRDAGLGAQIDPAAAFDFRTEFSTGIDSVVALSTWPANRTLRVLDTVPLAAERRELAAESMSDATLQLETSWFLSLELRTVVVVTEATLYDQTSDIRSDLVRYRADFAYASEPLPPGASRGLLQAWAADGGSHLRRVTREGVQETLALLADDVFTLRCGALQGEISGEEFEGRDPRTGAGDGWRGKTLMQSDTRVRLRHKDGHLFSVPAEYRKPVPVFRQEDFQFKISYRPDDRPCVQVTHPSGSARVWLDPAIALAENDGLTDARVDLVLRAAEKRAAELRTAWGQVHGARLRAAATPDAR